VTCDANGTHRVRRRALRAVVTAAALLVLAGTVVVAVSQDGGAAARGPRPSVAAASTRNGLRTLAPEPSSKVLASADNLPADCIPNPAGPPTAPYELGLVGTVTGGVLSTGAATVAGISATFCGIATIVNGTPPCGATGSVSSPPDGQVYGSMSVALTLVPGMTPSIGFTANPGTITGGFSCTSDPNGLDVSLDATVSGTTSPLFGVSCTIGPLTIPLSGVITGPFTDLTGTLTSHDITVPDVQASPTCPGSLPANVDAIAGLPIAAGGASATLPIKASLYQPAS